MFTTWFAVTVAMAGQPSPAVVSPSGLQPLLACRQLADEARLRCYDRAADELGAALKAGSLRVVNKEELQRTRRTLFGLSLPDTPLLGGKPGEEAEQIETTLRSARTIDNGRWELVLVDGGVWETTEADTRSLDPRPGSKVTVRRGRLGSYIITWQNGRPQRARRVR